MRGIFEQLDFTAFPYQTAQGPFVGAAQSEEANQASASLMAPDFPLSEDQPPAIPPVLEQAIPDGRQCTREEIPHPTAKSSSSVPDFSSFSYTEDPQLSIFPAVHYPKAEPMANLGKDYRESIIQQRSDPILNNLLNLSHLSVTERPKDLIPELEQAIVKHWIIGSYKESLYEYKSGVWKPYPRDAFIADVRNRYPTEIMQSNFGTKHFEELYGRLLTNPAVLLARPDAPSPFDKNTNLINLKDCVYNLEGDALLESNFQFYFSTQLNISREALEGPLFAPNFDHFIETSLNGDPELETLLLEILGVLLVGKRLRYIFVFYGPSGCGKSLMIDLVQRILGLEHVQEEPISYRTAITVLLFTGMRRGELLGLKWSDINFDNNTISIERSLLYLPDKGLFEDETKTIGSDRVIKVPATAMLALKEYKAWQNQQRLLLGTAWGNSAYAFTSSEGETMRPDTLTNWFHAFIMKTDLPPIHLHSLRHTNATLQIANGVPLTTVASNLGHADSATTTKIYAHAIQSAAAASAEMMDHLLNPVHESG